MHRITGRRPSPATVISLVALFVALGGTGYAAFAVPRNSVGSAQVVNHSLQTADLSRKAVSALKGGRGPEGPAGPQGPAGATGAAGTAGTARAYAEVDDSTPSLVAARTKNFTAVTRTDDGVYCLTPATGIDHAQWRRPPRRISGSRTPTGSSWSSAREATAAGQFEVETDDLDGDPTNDMAFDLVVP